MKIQQIFELKEILPYLKSRNLLKQYKKAKQFRALGVFDEHGNLIIIKIDNHQ